MIADILLRENRDRAHIVERSDVFGPQAEPAVVGHGRAGVSDEFAHAVELPGAYDFGRVELRALQESAMAQVSAALPRGPRGGDDVPAQWRKQVQFSSPGRAGSASD